MSPHDIYGGANPPAPPGAPVPPKTPPTSPPGPAPQKEQTPSGPENPASAGQPTEKPFEKEPFKTPVNSPAAVSQPSQPRPQSNPSRISQQPKGDIISLLQEINDKLDKILTFLQGGTQPPTKRGFRFWK